MASETHHHYDNFKFVYCLKINYIPQMLAINYLLPIFGIAAKNLFAAKNPKLDLGSSKDSKYLRGNSARLGWRAPGPRTSRGRYQPDSE
jgi:hypothetical protein